MEKNIISTKSKWIKVVQNIVFISTVMYILETIFIRGLFTNFYLALINMALSGIALIITAIKKEYKLAIINFIILTGTSLAFIYYLNYI
ncbi:MAG: hypothetical protein HUJ77_00415 [Clostridium sp.]|uniref:hypothetical protein n=1 Tax=Clostridium sp. TaxID=1506 RepID=UPI0025C38915|nr:hypothetical protein [Clostridium sp.]MCF0146838.1 hypothetical protein [Clostridium sp.]